MKAPSGHTTVHDGLVEYTHIMYACYALSVLMALGGSYSLALRFVFGLPSLIAVVMSYVRFAEVRGTWLETHFLWQRHTFWYSWLWIIVASIISMPLLIVIVGLITEVLALAAIGVWVSYRVVRGWMRLRAGEPMPLAS
jgi:uncharacterized membrane protein